jgi:cytochrome c oxidase assembly protein subunit 11
MSKPKKSAGNFALAVGLLSVSFAMVGASFAAVPLYRIFCAATGFAGTPVRANTGADHTLERTIVVRFDGNVAGVPWKFKPETPQVSVKLGETKLINFVAVNTGSTEVTGTATFNVQPDIAGAYFNKIQCFCFTEQTLEPGQKVEMPVQFFVSPDLADDPELAGTRAITLSYTFFPAADQAKSERQPVARTERDASAENL